MKREDYGEVLRVASFLGMSVEHSIYMDVDTLTYTYIVIPQSGSFEGLKRAAKMERELPVWTPRKNTTKNPRPLAQMETWKAACEFAQRMAFSEVAAENDYDLPESFWTGASVCTIPGCLCNGTFHEASKEESITGYTEEELTQMERENEPSFIEIRGAGLCIGDVMVLPFGKTATVAHTKNGRIYTNFKTEFGPGRVLLTDPIQIQPR